MAISALRIHGEQTDATTYRIDPPTRGAGTFLDIPVKKSDLLELVFEDDTVWMTSPDALEELFPETRRSRGELPGFFVVPSFLPAEGQERGHFSEIALLFLRILTGKGDQAIHQLAEELENRQLGDTRGLCRLSDDLSLEKGAMTTTGDQACLLFLHGTASSTGEAFKHLKGTEVWKQIRRLYADRVFAFQHATLTKNPLENVKELVGQLPAKATLHLISHSRGGLLGDILCRYCIGTGTNGFSGNELSYLRKNGRQKEVDLIGEIQQLISTKEIIIRKFIRVACPASGTTLASRRLDHYFNILFNLLGLATGQLTDPIYIAAKELLAAVVSSKSKVNVLPGLEAQDPGSPFLKMLNNAGPAQPITAPLIVVAGNSSLSLRWKALLVLVSRLFYRDKNDLIIDTRSMYNGARRDKAGMQYFLDESAEASHFNYFINPSTRAAILLALQHDGKTLIPGFSWQEQQATKEEIRHPLPNLPQGDESREEISGKRPIVLLLPGMMGSNVPGFSTPMRSPYKKLTDFLEEQGYEVVTFPYDWRLPPEQCTMLLKEKIESLLVYDQPIKIVGHSMGGVLLRNLMIDYPQTWDGLNQREGFRALLLGAPLSGSYRIPYLLFGEDEIIQLLAGVDLRYTRKELLEMFNRLPGLLSLLPLTKDAGHDLADPATWEELAVLKGDAFWPLPPDDALAAFGRYRDRILEKRGGIDYRRVVYIAGQSRPGRQTIKGYRTGEDGELEFIATREGDESVTWESGIPKELTEQGSVYYSDVSHGKLANKRRLFKAIIDLLKVGSTRILQRTPPAVRGDEGDMIARRGFSYDLTPRGVENALLGLSSRETYNQGTIPLRLSITNGDLKYAAYAVLAGHFYQDGLFSAEKHLDQCLDGELGRRLSLGLYPGEIGSNEIVMGTKKQIFKGAVIAGLGRQGELTPYLLTRTVELAVSRYLSVAGGGSGHPTGLTALAIGCGYGGLGMENSVRAVIQGVQNANERIRAIYPDVRAVGEIEFIEVFRDRAVSLAHVLQLIEGDENQNLNVVWENKRIMKRPGVRDRWQAEHGGDWWARIQVRQTEPEPGVVAVERPGMRFTMSTNAAREEERTLYTAGATVMQMLADMSTNNRWNAAIARTLFELLIPYDFKDSIKRQNNITWIVDKRTAAYPWELLQDSAANARPLSINAGMIRQLATPDYRVRINPVNEEVALIVGDPNLEQPRNQLPGALEEAKKVNEVLGCRGYLTVPLFQESAGQILTALFSRSYKIIHLAGHGIFNANPAEPSGMLIGKKTFLTTAEIAQMSTVPELVFVNCCYLGKVDGEAEAYRQDRYRLAAGIGIQLIDIGVKAVIVAGWAVDDDAGLAFADRFYDCLLAGSCFGEAVQKARKLIYERYRHRSNTWGAYQCYGDPLYRLKPRQDVSPSEYRFVLVEEAEIELRNLMNRIDTSGYDEAEIVSRIQLIGSAVDAAGLRTGVITELEAFLYAGLNRYVDALAKFKELFGGAKAYFSGLAMEKYCNVRAKYALQQGREDSARAEEWIEEIKKVILQLNFLQGYGVTIERLNLLGSAYKRMAMLSAATEKTVVYRQSAAYYTTAAKDELNKSIYYSLTNQLYIEYALGLAEPGGGVWVAQPAVLGQLKEQMSGWEKQSMDVDEKDYWDLVAGANLKLCSWFLDAPFLYEDAEAAYWKIWNYSGHQGNKQAEIEHLEFLEDLLQLADKESVDPVNRQRAKTLLEGIARLKERLKL